MYRPNLLFHFVGIGGVGMSGLAELLLSEGYRVSGSDLTLGESSKRLAQLGATVFEGHDSKNLPVEASYLVYSSAVPADNPELSEACRRGIPSVRRGELLAELMRRRFGLAMSGSHGKTTTTVMVGRVLEEAGLDPTVVVGARVSSYGGGTRIGKGDFFVAESDESDRSFLLLNPAIVVVTNIDAEHLNAYNSLSDLEQCFNSFINSLPFYGLAVLCIDDPRVKKLAERYRGRKLTYSLHQEADLQAEINETGGGKTKFSIIYRNKHLCEVSLPLPGEHFVLNALAASAVGLELGAKPLQIARALSDLPAIGRRMEIVGQKSGITILTDYAHHPTEITATIRAVRQGWCQHSGKLHLIFQPHRYTRTRDCLEQYYSAFTGCDSLYITEIHSAGEAPIEGISARALAAGIDHPDCQFIGSPTEAIEALIPQLKEGDLVLLMGAGSINSYATKLLTLL